MSRLSALVACALCSVAAASEASPPPAADVFCKWNDWKCIADVSATTRPSDDRAHKFGGLRRCSTRCSCGSRALFPAHRKPKPSPSTRPPRRRRAGRPPPRRPRTLPTAHRSAIASCLTLTTRSHAAYGCSDRVASSDAHAAPTASRRRPAPRPRLPPTRQST
eukprot:6097683-Prymnesium_polylepis.1